MDFNAELQKLIDKANKNGYDFKDGKFEKLDVKKMPVMEEFLIDNSTYEATGYWKIFKKTIRISEEDYKIIKEYAKETDYKNFLVNCSTEIDDEFYEKILENVLKYDESKMYFTETNVGRTIQLIYDDSFYTEDDEIKECVDLWFTKEDDDCDFPRGYISFYEMPSYDFEKADNIDLNIEKYIKHN